jgi:1-acyl-sn-glycerol-3-phosphate acyltransferase
LQVEGAENVPRAGGLLIVSNHKSYLDPPLIGSTLPREIFYLAKRELFEMPIVGTWVRRHNAIPIDREGFDRAAIERAMGILGRGDALLVFPEGTRILRPDLGPPREGIAWLATRSRVPVVPLYIKGSWSKERGWFRRGGIRIRIGKPVRLPPVPPGKAGRREFPTVSARLMEEIGALAPPSESG